MKTRAIRTNIHGEKFIYLKDGEYVLTYNTLTRRCVTAQFAPQHFKLMFTDHEELVGIFHDSNELYTLKKNIEQIRSILDS